jgi:hypothetical protein
MNQFMDIHTGAQVRSTQEHQSQAGQPGLFLAITGPASLEMAALALVLHSSSRFVSTSSASEAHGLLGLSLL